MLTIIEPWATLIVLGYKNVENRSWYYGDMGQLVIHAGKNTSILKDGYAIDFYRRMLEDNSHLRDRWKSPQEVEAMAYANLGKIIGQATIEGADEPGWPSDILHRPWADREQYNWLLSNQKQYKEPIPYKGAQGLQRIDTALIPEYQGSGWRLGSGSRKGVQGKIRGERLG